MDANMKEAIALQTIANEITARERSMNARDEAVARLRLLSNELEEFGIPQFFTNELWEIEKLVSWDWRYGA